MQKESRAVVVTVVLVLLATSMILTSLPFVNIGNTGSHTELLSSNASDPAPYSENLALYLTSTQSLWLAHLSGGNISLGVTVPSGISNFTITLTHYNTWNSQYEVFTKYGFGYLGSQEPMPNATLLTISATSQSAASSFAATLSQTLALDFSPYASNSSTFTFISPMNFATEMQIYFWNLLPRSAGGFANFTTTQQFESGNLLFFQLSYLSGIYAISYGAIQALSSSTSFSLYSQLGVSSLNYSSTASTSSSVEIHVLGGLVTNSSVKPTNYLTNFSSLITESKTASGNLTVPNISASLDFSFPTIVAYRQVSPLSVSSNTANSSVSVSITVKDVSPSGTPNANVSFDDSGWYKSLGFSESGQSSASYSLASGGSNTTIYFVSIPNSTSSYAIPSTPVTYSFTAANQTVTATAYLNNETMLVNPTGGSAALEAIENVNSATASAGQALSVNITIKNWGPGPAASVTVAGHTLAQPILAGGSANYTVTSGSSSLTQTSALIDNVVSWTDTSGTHSLTTNAIGAVYSFGNPGSPSMSLSKSISVSSDKTSANVTLILSNGGSSALTNLTITDPVPNGLTFGASLGNRSVTFSNGIVSASLANLSSGASVTYVYSVNISNPHDNYVFLPANVSTTWNGLDIAHFSQGAGIALGVIATKTISPNSGFQGSNVTENLGIQNLGSLPIYYVSFAGSTDAFLANLNTSSKVTKMLTQGQSINSTIDANITGSPGVYNTSIVAASFVFAGTNQTAPSSVFTVTVYKDLYSILTVTSSSIEEEHNINITITIDNPSNVTVTNVNYQVTLPPNLQLVSSSGSLKLAVASLGPNQTVTGYFLVTTNIPLTYTIPRGTLTFQYHGKTLNGLTTSLTVKIADDLLTRYAIPVVVGLLIVIGTLYYVRRLVRAPNPKKP